VLAGTDWRPMVNLEWVQPFPARQRSGNGGPTQGTKITLTIESGQYVGPKLLPSERYQVTCKNLSKVLLSESTSFYLSVVCLTMPSAI